MRRTVIAVGFGVLAAATAAHAARPVLAGEQTFGQAGGQILVHYATTGSDAVLATDANSDGVPDFVAEVATTAETALQHYIALGFVRPVSDGTLGGDGRIDIYLRDLVSADGNAGIDSCDGDRCAGFIQSENDFAGYTDYATLTEGIRSVVPHELFHLVQDAYAAGQVATWTEASAVWAVENLYGDGCSDFERFLPSFLPKMYRPFERAPAAFDSYPYGAALFPYFLEQRFGVGVVVAAWQASATAPFLDAVDAALAPLATFPAVLDSDRAFIEMSRWNVFTGSRAAGGPYPAEASSWPEVSLEPAVSADAPSAQVAIAGLSARYVPVVVTARSSLTVSPGALTLDAWAVRDGGTLDDGLPLLDTTGDAAVAPSDLATNLEPGHYTLVITGLSRNIVTTPVTVVLGPPVTSPIPLAHDGGCTAARSPDASLIAIALAFLVTARLLRRPERPSRA